MKTCLIIIISTLVLVTSIKAQESTFISQEKVFAEKYLKETLSHLHKTVESLEGEVLTYKSTPESWSIVNCLEHLALAEFTLLAQIQKTVNKNEVDLNKDYSARDGLIITEITDRTRKVKTLPPFEPTSQQQSKEDLLKRLDDARANVLDYLLASEGDLRHIFAPYPYGETDAYQQFLIIGAHMVRHTLQIKEILQDFEGREM